MNIKDRTITDDKRLPFEKLKDKGSLEVMEKWNDCKQTNRITTHKADTRT